MTDNTATLSQITTDTYLHEVDGALLAITAQQAVLPRQIRDGELYAILDADGAVQIVETPGYTDSRAIARAAKPRVIDRYTTVIDAASFLDYISENTTSEGMHAHTIEGDDSGSLEVWADIDQSAITAILDGYGGWRQHTCTLRLKKSREWADWASIDGKLLDQEAFAEFIEDHLSTIAEPDGAKLLDICQTLTGHTNQQWRSQQLLANGQRQFKWEEQVEAKAGAKGDLTIPTHLTLVLRPYQGGEEVAVKAAFRFRLRAGELLIGVKLSEPDRVLEDAFAGICQQVQAGIPEQVTIRHGRG